MVDEYLSDQFAYTFALENLCQSIENSFLEPLEHPHQIYLPENPLKDFCNDFYEIGFVIPQRIISNIKDFELIDFEDFENPEQIKSRLYGYVPKIYYQKHGIFTLTSLSTYFKNQYQKDNFDIRTLMDNGLKVVVSERKEQAGSWLINRIVAAANFVWNKVKAAATVVKNFAFSVVKTGFNLLGKAVSFAGSVVGKGAQLAGNFVAKIAKPLMDTKVGKYISDAVNDVKELGIDAAYVALGGVETVIKYAKKGANIAGEYAKKGLNAAIDFGKATTEWIPGMSILKNTAEKIGKEQWPVV
uniref:Senescence domain-containing protein n=1 Tax=Panagrolaimus superbus TaxID=310955 RepID=A0A914YDQ9_9BILA